MKIHIKDRCSAYSHTPGHETMIPGTNWKVRAFPAALMITCCKMSKKDDFFFALEGPVSPFTVEQDIENSCIRIYGESKKGYFRFRIQQEKGSLFLFVEKTPEKGIKCFGKENIFMTGDQYEIAKGLVFSENIYQEQLFLGSNRCKDWDRIRRDENLDAILPLWYRLGQKMPLQMEKELGPVFDLLTHCEVLIQNQDKSIYESIKHLYFAGFSGGLVPRSYDAEYQGIFSYEPSSTFTSACSLLSRGSQLIRSMFFQEKENKYFILPCLPSQFVSGRMVGVKTKDSCFLSFEWTKHQMRQMTFFSSKEKEVFLLFPSTIKNYRVRFSLKDKGCIIKNGDALSVIQGKTLLLDRFCR